MSLIRGVLLAGQFRTQHEINTMSHGDQRNTLIVELAGRTKQTGLQAFNDDTLAGMGAVLVFLRAARIRNDADLKGLTADDMRNVLIVELGAQTQMSGPALQGMSNLDLVLLGLGKPQPGALTAGSFIRGVLLAGQFRTQHELNRMSADDQRNTLIVEMAGHSNQSNFQGLDDFALAGAGAVMVFLRGGRIRTDAELQKMSADDQRNVAIVEIGSQTNLGSRLQGLRSMDLVRVALGVDPESIFKEQPHGPGFKQPVGPFFFSVDRIDVRTQKSDGDHSDSDWLTIIVTIANPVTKDTRTLPATIHHIGASVKSGNVIAGPFSSDPIDAGDSDVVVVNYFITNLGSSDVEEQGAQIVKVANKVVGVVAPIAGAIIGTIVAGQTAEGMKIGQEIAKGFDTVISTLSDVFDFLGLHFGPPNCNGIVLQDTLTYLPNDSSRPHAERERYTGSQGNDRCGAAPQTTVDFSMSRPAVA